MNLKDMTMLAPITLHSNSSEFLRTRKIPIRSHSHIVEVSWVEEWTNKDGNNFEVSLTRLFDGYKTVKWDMATSFAFKLAGGFSSSLKIHKTWDVCCTDKTSSSDVFSRVISVAVVVNFSTDAGGYNY